jgi:hypothetical protein
MEELETANTKTSFLMFFTFHLISRLRENELMGKSICRPISVSCRFERILLKQQSMSRSWSTSKNPRTYLENCTECYGLEEIYFWWRLKAGKNTACSMITAGGFRDHLYKTYGGIFLVSGTPCLVILSLPFSRETPDDLEVFRCAHPASCKTMS